MEDKQKILDALCKAREEVIVKYTSGNARRINTSLDSGLAMIRDVCEHIG